MAIVATTAVAMVLTLIGDSVDPRRDRRAAPALRVHLHERRGAGPAPGHGRPSHFRVWTAVPVLGVASCVLLLTQQTAKVWLFAAILLAVGAVLTCWRVRPTRPDTKADPPEGEAPSPAERCAARRMAVVVSARSPRLPHVAGVSGFGRSLTARGAPCGRVLSGSNSVTAANHPDTLGASTKFATPFRRRPWPSASSSSSSASSGSYRVSLRTDDQLTLPVTTPTRSTRDFQRVGAPQPGHLAFGVAGIALARTFNSARSFLIGGGLCIWCFSFTA